MGDGRNAGLGWRLDIGRGFGTARVDPVSEIVAFSPAGKQRKQSPHELRRVAVDRDIGREIPSQHFGINVHVDERRGRGQPVTARGDFAEAAPDRERGVTSPRHAPSERRRSRSEAWP